jgi:hypothetical protein
MKTLTTKSTYEHSNRILPINNPAQLKSYKEILERISEQMTAMLSHHSQIMSLRLDLHTHSYTERNKEVSRLMEKIKRHLRSKYSMTRSGYVWVREIESAQSQHYHLLLLLNADKIRHPGKLIKWIEDRWTAWGNPKPYTPQNCYSIINRKNDSEFNKAFYRASYLAKERGKGHKQKSTNDFSASRIKAKEKTQ